MKTITDRKRIQEVFDRGIVTEVLPSKEVLIERLVSGERLRIYIGADPTSDTLHLSHAKNYMFLEELRQLGHEVIMLVGDFTALIGDPSGRNAARPQLTEAEIKKNVKGWISQIKPLMDFTDKKNPPKVLYNSKWLSKLSFKDLISLSSNFTVQQMLERDMFQKRVAEKAPIYMHEFLYPLMQGYDSVAMDVDVELCGTDQIFNALAGRTLVKRFKNKEKFVIAVNLMANPKTGELMSKSRGTGVFLSSQPNEMYGAIMAQPDEMIEVLFVNCTRIPMEDKNKIFDLGPRDAKAKIALEIVKRFYGEKKAIAAQENFEKVFAKKELSDVELPILPFLLSQSGEVDAVDLVMCDPNITSKSEAWRLISGGGFEIDNKKIIDPRKKIDLKEVRNDSVIKIGKKHFFRARK